MLMLYNEKRFYPLCSENEKSLASKHLQAQSGWSLEAIDFIADQAVWLLPALPGHGGPAADAASNAPFDAFPVDRLAHCGICIIEIHHIDIEQTTAFFQCFTQGGQTACGKKWIGLHGHVDVGPDAGIAPGAGAERQDTHILPAR